MRTKVTLVLIFLNVALFFFIFKFERPWRTEAASLEARRRVLGAEAADIRSLEIASTAPGGSFALTRQRDSWLLTKPLQWPANPSAVSAILHQLMLLEHETSFPTKDLAKSGQSLADYGLEKPKLMVTFTSGDPTLTGSTPTSTTLSIGDTTKVGNRLYILSPQRDRIHVVNRAQLDSLSQSLDQLRDDALLTVPVFEASMLGIQTVTSDQTRGGTTASARVRIRRDGTRWIFDAPINARASRAAVEITINQLNSLRAKNFAVAPPATAPSLAPTLRISLEGNSRHETLFLGEPVAPPAAGADTIDYYAQLENRPTVFSAAIPVKLLEVLRTATELLREKHLLDFDPRTVTAVTLAAPAANQPNLTLQRLETTAPAAENGAWQIVRRSGEAQGLQTTPADRAAVERLLTQLVQLSATSPGGFVSDNPTNAELENWGFNRPEREITLTLLRATPAPVAGVAPAAPATGPVTTIVRFGTDANRKLFARVISAGDPGSSIYAVNVDLAREFPMETVAWRDRALPALPANARITALKLTELAGNRVAFETTFDANGQPATTPANPAALQAVLGFVRAPRAGNFRIAAFADRVLTGGEERPWSYLLEAAVSLPGSEQGGTRAFFLADRTGGAEQLVGSKEFDAIFTLEQSAVDALWQLIYGPRDPGPPPAATENANAKAPNAK